MLSLLNLLRACPLEVIQLFYQQTFLLRADGGTAGVAGLSDIALTKSDRQVWLGTDYRQYAYGRSRPIGGQFSSFIPKVKPRADRTSLISLSDLRPRFGVLSNSFSVR